MRLLYSGGVVLIFATFVLLYRHAWSRRAQLGLTPVDELKLRYGMRAHLCSGPVHAWNGYQQGAALSRLEREPGPIGVAGGHA